MVFDLFFGRGWLLGLDIVLDTSHLWGHTFTSCKAFPPQLSGRTSIPIHIPTPCRWARHAPTPTPTSLILLPTRRPIIIPLTSLKRMCPSFTIHEQLLQSLFRKRGWTMMMMIMLSGECRGRRCRSDELRRVGWGRKAL